MENELSAKIRFAFVKSYRLRGIAIWRLGYETSRFWQRVNDQTQKIRLFSNDESAMGASSREDALCLLCSLAI